ncbi:LOW QUALITY PROTEIN: hypothetical protein Bca4012_058327 [Brassica carinata]
MKHGDSSVREYNTLFLKSGLHEKHGEETLVHMYREGLREDIRSQIESNVFSSIDDIMKAALDVEEGETPSNNNGSSTYSVDSESDGSDESEKPPQKARTEKNNKDDQVDEEAEADDDETDQDETDADNDSECSLPNPLEGSDDEPDSMVDLKDYQKYLEKHHKSPYESSGESD